MLIRTASLLLLASALAPSAQARCERLIAQADSASDVRLVAIYESVIRCDEDEAKVAFSRFMRSADNSETLTALSLVAIDNEIWNPVWEMIGRISDYSARDTVADSIGTACIEHSQVMPFLQGAYFGLRDIDFQQWDDALISCESEAFEAWLVSTVTTPPPRRYDEKWDTMVKAYVIREGTSSLANLAESAVKAAANEGPFDAILAHMEEAVAPVFGSDVTQADQDALEAAFISVAERIAPERARAVAGRLANSGSDAAAAALLPRIFPDRVQPEGGFLYGAAAIESGDCDGELVATVHVALINEPGSRFELQVPLAAPMRAFRARMSRCEVVEPWPIVVSGSPLANRGALEPFVDQLITMWELKGYEVKRRNERAVSLP